jgi:hypothetical protein
VTNDQEDEPKDDQQRTHIGVKAQDAPRERTGALAELGPQDAHLGERAGAEQTGGARTAAIG